MKNIFKLKRNILASIFVLTGGMLSNLSMANAYDGKITFTGKISSGTCEITGGNTNGTESTNPNFTVTLPTVSTTAFKSLGDRAGDTDFFIKLKGAECVIGDGYAIKFEKISSAGFIDPNTGYLKNILPDGAKNIQLIISDEDKKDFDFRTTRDTSPTKNRGNVNDETIFNFSVQYISTAATGVTSGKIESGIYYSVVYP